MHGAKVLFVCDGTSAGVPWLMRQTLTNEGIELAEVSSGGLVASPWGIAHAQLRSFHGSTYRLVENRHSQPLTQESVRASDLILGMEDRHVYQILERSPESDGRVDKTTTYAGKDGEIKD